MFCKRKCSLWICIDTGIKRAGKSNLHLENCLGDHRRAETHLQVTIPTTQRIGFVRFIERAWLSWPLAGWIVFFSLLTFKPIWSSRRKVLLMRNHSLQQRCVRGCRREGSIIWLYNYPSEQNALFVLIWSICDTEPCWAGTTSHPFLINVLSDERLWWNEKFEFEKNQIRMWFSSLITGPVTKEWKKKKRRPRHVFWVAQFTLISSFVLRNTIAWTFLWRLHSSAQVMDWYGNPLRAKNKTS